MKITILFASPNAQGSRRILADSFSAGTREAGHTLELIDVAKANIAP